MFVLQIGLLFKSILTAILWGLCLYAWFEGQLPASMKLAFRQPHCLDSTAIVAFFVPLRRNDEHYARSRALIILYVSQPRNAPAPSALADSVAHSQTIFWAILLVAGSYWTFRAPIVLRRRGGHFKPKPVRGKREDRFFSTPEEREARRKRREKMSRDPADYTPSSADDVSARAARSALRGHGGRRRDRRRLFTRR